MYYGISSIEVRHLIFEYVEQNEIPNNFNKESRLAGQDGFYLFLKEENRISVKKSEPTSISRKTSFNKLS